MRLISTIELRRRVRKIVPCEYQSNPVAKLGTAEAVIRNPLYRSIPHCLATMRNDTRKYFQVSIGHGGDRIGGSAARSY
jgi:hypothetical protein